MEIEVDKTGAPSSPPGEVRAPVLGACLLAAAAAAAYVLRVGGRCCGGLVARDLYDYGTWVLVVALAVAGLVLLTSRTASLRVLAAAAGGVIAAQLAGTAVVAFRRWVPVGGFGHGTWDNLSQLRTVSALLAICSLGAVVACLASLRDDRAVPVQVGRLARAVAAAAGLLVAVALPIIVAGGRSDVLDIQSLGAHALVYSLPLGVSLVLTGWLSRAAAWAVALAVMASGLVLADPNRQLVTTPAHTSGLVLVLVAATAVLVTRAARADRAGPS